VSSASEYDASKLVFFATGSQAAQYQFAHEHSRETVATVDIPLFKQIIDKDIARAEAALGAAIDRSFSDRDKDLQVNRKKDRGDEMEM
jgi:hypothetical protein